jgi:hypothetical protein
MIDLTYAYVALGMGAVFGLGVAAVGFAMAHWAESPQRRRDKR